MKKILVLMLHRSPENESIKDGGPALVREVANAFKRKGYEIDYLSGNKMDQSKQFVDLTPFFQRMHKASEFAKEIDTKLFNTYDIILFFHPSTLMGFEATDLPLNKMVLFPTLLGKEYEHFIDVPSEYIDLEKKILSYGYLIQCPSHAQAQLLVKEYSVPEKYIFIHPRGFSPDLFPPYERNLRTDISFEKPLRLISANAVRPQKGYSALVDFISVCAKNKLPVKVIVYGDTAQSTNKTYLAYAQDFIRKIQKEGLQNYFEINAAVAQESLGAEMKKSDMALIPSIYESFGKSALEASGSGLPTIVFDDVNVYREFLSDESAIFSLRTPQGFFDSLSSVISNKERYHQLSVAGIQNGAKYFSKDIYAILVTFIEVKIKSGKQEIL